MTCAVHPSQASAARVVSVQGGSEWWQSHVGKDLSADFPTKPRPESMPDNAKQGRPNPRKDFEENVLKNVRRTRPSLEHDAPDLYH